MDDRFDEALSFYHCRTEPDFGWSLHPSFHFLVQSQQGLGIQGNLNISKKRMVKYFSNNTDIRSVWDHVVSAFWQRYPNPYRYYDVFIVSIPLENAILSVVGVKRQTRTEFKLERNILEKSS